MLSRAQVYPLSRWAFILTATRQLSASLPQHHIFKDPVHRQGGSFLPCVSLHQGQSPNPSPPSARSYQARVGLYAQTRCSRSQPSTREAHV